MKTVTATLLAVLLLAAGALLPGTAALPFGSTPALARDTAADHDDHDSIWPQPSGNPATPLFLPGEGRRPS